MSDLLKGLRIVVLESPYDTWEDPRVPDLFKEMVDLKLRGYGCEHLYGILPVDGADFISTHLMLCRAEGERLRPIMGIRWTSHVKCREHYLNFPGLSLVQQAGTQEHISAVETIISNADRRGADLFYCGALSIHPDEKGNKERSLLYRELLTSMYVGYMKDNSPSELIAGGTLRFKIDKWIRSIGHAPLKYNGIELPTINVKHLAGEEVHVMHLEELTFEARRIAKKWQGLWNERCSILVKDVQRKIIRKAA